MSASVFALLGAALTTLLLGLLASYDPKRLRVNRRRDGPAMSTGMRRTLGVGALVPGIVLAFGAYWSAFLMWLGLSCIAGWMLAMAFATIANHQR